MQKNFYECLSAFMMFYMLLTVPCTADKTDSTSPLHSRTLPNDSYISGEPVRAPPHNPEAPPVNNTIDN